MKIKMYVLELNSPLDMAGAGGDQDNGWFADHGIQVQHDHILLSTTRTALVRFLYGYEDDYTGGEPSMAAEIKEVECEIQTSDKIMVCASCGDPNQMERK